jgi:hypothetical protein
LVSGVVLSSLTWGITSVPYAPPRTKFLIVPTAFKIWLEQQLARIPKGGVLAVAIRYALTRFTALSRYLDDGTLEIDNNIAERAIRGLAVGRKNWLFAGSDTGG